MNKRLVLGAGTLLSVAAVAVLVWPRGGTAVEKAEVVDSFRRTSIGPEAGADGAGRTSTGERAAHADETGPVTPTLGVYTYFASGQQEMKFGPLPTETRVVPAQIVASVTGADKCFDYELNLFAEHIERTTLCAALSKDRRSLGLTIDAHTKRMKVGPAIATATLECGSPLVIADGTDTEGVPCSLTLSGGPMEVKADLSGSVSVGSPETVDIGGQLATAHPVSIEYLASGKVTGAWREKMWMSETNWLPLKVVRQVDLSGPASIRENSELTLESLEPAV